MVRIYLNTLIMKAIWLIILIILIYKILKWTIKTYNKYQLLKQEIKEQTSNINTESQRKKDLYNNLSRTIRSYKGYESQLQKDITNTRANKDTRRENKEPSIINGYNNVSMEAYPKLEAQVLHDKVMNQLETTENRIQKQRSQLNQKIREYNTMTKTYPTNIIAYILNYQTTKYYQTQE